MDTSRRLEQTEQPGSAPLTLVTPFRREFGMLVDPPRVEPYETHGHENYSADLLLNLSHGAGLFVDVGAHYGFYTLLLGVHDRNLRILALEPCEENFAVLQRNINHNGLENVEPLCLAVSDSAGVGTFRVADNSGPGGFYEPFLGRTVEQVEVRTVALDTLLADAPNTPTVVKIDTEGHEIPVLDGMKQSLARLDDVRLLVEFNPEMQKRAGHSPEELLVRLFDLGFDVYFIVEEPHRHLKLERRDVERWPEFIGSLFNANLLCIKQARSLSVCLFSHSAGLAGAERSLLQLVTELTRDHGTLCTVVLPSEGPLKCRLEEVGAATIVAGCPWWCSPSGAPEASPGVVMAMGSRVLLEELLPALAQVNPDVFLTNTMVLPWGAVSAMLTGKPHVWFVREFGEEDHGMEFFFPLETVRRFILDGSNTVMANSKAVAESLVGDDVTARPMTVYVDIETPSATSAADGARHFRSASAVRLLMPGAVIEGKGQEDAVLAVAELTMRGHDVELLVMGWRDKRYFERLQAIVDDKGLGTHVRFEDFQEDPYPVMAEADVVLVCSRKEAFGRVALEAMLLGKPVVASNAGGLPEIVRHGETGFLYEPRNPKDLANKVEVLIRNPELRAEFGRKGLETAKECFTAAGYGGKIAPVLRGLKAERNSLVGNWFPWLGLSDVLLDAMSQRRHAQEQLHAQLAELAELTAAQERLTLQLAEREQAMQESIRKLADTDHSLQEVTYKLAGITSSTAWAAMGILSKMRSWLAPCGSLREALLRMGVRGLLLWHREGLKPLLRAAIRKARGKGQKAAPAAEVPEMSEPIGEREVPETSEPIGDHKVGVVIVTHNAALATRVTLASLRQAKNATPYEVTVVDNASRQIERDAIRRAVERHARDAGLPWRYVQLDENRGFAGGNNVGIEGFMADNSVSHICLLNSDVIVSDSWLDRLVQKACDVVSPVTNKADSVQFVPADYEIDLAACLEPATESMVPRAFDAVNAFSQMRYRACRGNVVPVEDATFFCVLLTRDLVQKVGLLDPTFFPGGYEDDDYCARIRALGTGIHLARDVFVHHWGSASFGQLQREYSAQRALQNRRYLEEKHGIHWKARYHAPILSFAQDVVHALRGLGEPSLQPRYQALHVKMLTQLLTHYEQEFTALHSQLRSSGRSVPWELEQGSAHIAARGSLIKDWRRMAGRIGKCMAEVPCDPARVAAVARKLAELAEAVYQTAACNVSMHELLFPEGTSHGNEPVQLVPGTRRWMRALWVLRNGTAFLRRLRRGVVFFGGYPYPERETDGYFQRIRAVDTLCTDRWRIYVDGDKSPGRDGWCDSPARNVLVLHVTGSWTRKWAVRLCVILCALRCRVVYFHSVLRMRDALFRLLLWLPGITKLVDLHGAVPEEFRYHDDSFEGWRYDRYERLALKRTDYAIVVSEAMGRHCRQKWHGAVRAQLILLPNVPEIAAGRAEKVYPDGKPIVIYAGGLHKWQQVPKMIDAIAGTADTYAYRIFCPKPDDMRALLPLALRSSPNVVVARKPYDELLKVYAECHYGFILREDVVVNHVACPTKLVEYVAMGVVPVVDCEEIGDFKALGMRCIGLEDLVAGRLPDEATRSGMARENLALYGRLRELCLAGGTAVQEAISLQKRRRDGRTKRLVVRGVAWGRRVMPPGTLRGRVARHAWRLVGRHVGGARPLPPGDKLQQPSDITSSKRAEDMALPPCDILVQVDSFLTGGLENVVLDVNEALIKAGWRVNLLVLGKAGEAVERARSRGVPVCVAPFDDAAYTTLLQSAAPKIVIGHYSIQGAAICAQAGICMIQVIHNTYMWLSEDQMREFSEAARHIAVLVAVSEFVKTYSEARLGVPPEKCLVIPNGVDIEGIRGLDVTVERSRLRRKHRFEDGDFVFLNVGAVNHQKNQMGLVKAFHIALRDCPRAKLVMLGPVYEKELFAEIEQYIGQHGLGEAVIYAGESPNSYPYYAMADAFVGSSFFEGGQLVLLEALAANLPVVTTEVGFAGMFRGKEGIALVRPPVDIPTYHGQIWELHSTAEFEADLAAQMRGTYAQRVRPDLPDDVVQMLDKRHSYKLYVSLVRQLLETGQIPAEGTLASWPTRIGSSKATHRE